MSGLFLLVGSRKLELCVYNDMITVVLDLKCIILKYMLETINYNKVNPVI